MPLTTGLLLFVFKCLYIYWLICNGRGTEISTCVKQLRVDWIQNLETQSRSPQRGPGDKNLPFPDHLGKTAANPLVFATTVSFQEQNKMCKVITH